MDITFLRHGIAINHDNPQCPADFERYLTPEGKTRMKIIAEWMLDAGFSFDRVYSSLLVRARQTAEIVVRQLNLENKLELSEKLVCGASLSDFRSLLGPAAENDSILFVGHEPDLGMAVGNLIGSGYIPMKRGGFACVRTSVIQQGKGRLLFLVPPNLLVGKKLKR